MCLSSEHRLELSRMHIEQRRVQIDHVAGFCERQLDWYHYFVFFWNTHHRRFQDRSLIIGNDGNHGHENQQKKQR